MKVTMNTLYAGPQGVARPGTVIDVPEEVAKRLKEGNYARDFDRERDARNPQGITRSPQSY